MCTFNILLYYAIEWQFKINIHIYVYECAHNHNTVTTITDRVRTCLYTNFMTDNIEKRRNNLDTSWNENVNVIIINVSVEIETEPQLATCR